MSEPRRSARAPAPIVPIMKPAPETKAKKAPAKAAAKGGKRAQYDEDDDESDEDEEESEDDFEERKKPAKKAKVAAKKASKVEEEKVTVAALKLGDTLSSVVLKTEEGKEIDVTKLGLAEDGKAVVFFTYPKANTGGCTAQAKLFQEKLTDFVKLGYSVYGLGADSVKSLASWKEKLELEYTLLSDTGRTLIGALGAGASGSPKRSHFVFDKDGKLILSTIGVKPANSATDCLASIEA